MKFKFIGNAGGIFTGSEGTRILCDPWITFNNQSISGFYNFPKCSHTKKKSLGN